MLYQFTKEELTSSKICSVKDQLLKKKAWWHFFQKHKEELPQYILDTISRILSCKLHTRGYSEYCCSNPACTHVNHVPFTCKSRFCSSCGKKATEHWVQTQLSVLPACDYQHITFTMPREFWRLFKDNWPLINLLPKVAHDILLEIARKKGLLPGIFTAIHTFGRDLKHNPHLHVSATKGGLNKEETTFKPIAKIGLIFQKAWKNYAQITKPYHNISDNGYIVDAFRVECARTIFKWFNRRGRRRPLRWNKFNRMMQGMGFPKAGHIISMFPKH